MKALHLLLSLLAADLLVPQLNAATSTFTSSGSVAFADLGATRTATPYPSTLAVSGVAADPVSAVKVTINSLSHPRPDDIQMLLVSPWGAKLVLFADAGGGSVAVTGANITFDDDAASVAPDAGPLPSSASYSYKPSCYDQPSPGNIATQFPGVTIDAATDVAGPGLSRSATFTSVFAGNHDVNGTWSLYVTDDVAGTDGASFSSWTLSITTSPSVVATTTTLSSSQNPAATGSSVTMTATVIKQTDLTAVTSGSVVFRDGATTLATVALDGSGHAGYSTTSLVEGDHAITADYSPGAGFLASTANLSQRIDNATQRSGNTFSNPGSLTLASTGSGVANVYPSHILVSGLSGTIAKVTLTATGITMERPDDLELLLVAPGGQSLIVVSDAGGFGSMTGISFVFDDSAASSLPDATTPGSGTYRPSSFGPSALPAPAPTGPNAHPAPQGSSTFASIFNGASPNGTWSLYAFDDATGDGATISGGWALTFTTTSDAATATTLSSSPNPSLTGANVTFTASVLSSGNPVTAGTVTFRAGATSLGGAVALDGAGQASLTTAALAEGTHVITADYNGSAGSFNLSSGSASHSVDNATVVAGNEYCRPGTLAFSSVPGDGSIYPSHITVSGLAGPLTQVTLALAGLTVGRADDLEFLLVSPAGTAFVVLGDAGGTTAGAINVNLVLDDAAASLVPDSGPFTAGTFRPTSVNSSPTAFPAPAPPIGTYLQPAPAGTATFATVFNGSNPNGIWSLYALSDVGGDSGSLTQWCLTLDTDQPPVATDDTVYRDKDRPVKVPITELLANDLNSDGPAPTFVSVVSTSVNGAAVHVVGGWIGYEAIPGSNADDSFTYTITDGTTTATGTVNVRVQRPDTATANLVIRTSGSDVLLGLGGIPGRTYQFQYTGSLTAPIQWSNLGSPFVADAAGKGSYTDVAPPSRFYRATQP